MSAEAAITPRHAALTERGGSSPHAWSGGAPVPGMPVKSSGRRPWGVLAGAVAGFVAVTWLVGWRQGFLWAIGVGYGLALAGAAFGFTTGWRVWITRRDAKGLWAQFAAIAVAMSLSVPLLATHPELAAANGPLSVSLLVGAFVFGLAMQIADGCGSGTLYKAGLGHPVSLAVLPAFVAGSFLGSSHLSAWLALGALPPVNLVQRLGAAPTLALQLGALAVLGALLWVWSGQRRGGAAFVSRWSGPAVWWAALALALLSVANLVVAGQPWGIVYGLGLWGAKLVQSVGWDLSHDAFWAQAAQQAQLHATVLTDNTSVTNLGLLWGALLAARWRAQGAPTVRLSMRAWAASVVAGLVLGYSSRLAFGCNVGAFFSGMATGSVHGWIWFALAFLGSVVGVRLRRGLGLPD